MCCIFDEFTLVWFCICLPCNKAFRRTFTLQTIRGYHISYNASSEKIIFGRFCDTYIAYILDSIAVNFRIILTNVTVVWSGFLKAFNEYITEQEFRILTKWNATNQIVEKTNLSPFSMQDQFAPVSFVSSWINWRRRSTLIFLGQPSNSKPLETLSMGPRFSGDSVKQDLIIMNDVFIVGNCKYDCPSDSYCGKKSKSGDSKCTCRNGYTGHPKKCTGMGSLQTKFF